MGDRADRPGPLTALLLHLHPRYIPASRARIGFTLCLGGISFFLFLVLVASGVQLAFRFMPCEMKATGSVSEIAHAVPFGDILRGIHYWAGQLMVVMVVLHMLRVFFTGSYKPPRSFNWVAGTGLLLLTLLTDFSGYLLRGDATTRWAAQTSARLMSEVPILGGAIHTMAVGGETMAPGWMLRAYVWHCFGLPGAILALSAYHFWRVRQDGLGEKPL